MDETVLFIVILEVTGKERYYKLGCPKWICTRWFTFYSCVLTTFKNKNSEKNKQKLSYLKFLPKRQPCFENLKLCSFNYSSSLILEVFKMQIKKKLIYPSLACQMDVPQIQKIQNKEMPFLFQCFLIPD